MKYLLARIILLASLITALASVTRAAVYQETNGVVVVEAEHFDQRVADPADPNHNWKIVPDEDPGTGDAQDRNARGGKYIQSLPDAGQNKNTDASVVGTAPYVEYKVSIKTVGTYRLYLRFGGWDGASDSIYAQILELKTSNGGPGPDWYRYIGQVNPADDTTIVDFALVKDTTTGGNALGWNGDGEPMGLDGGGGEIAANYNIASAGVYTIRISQREDGSALDALLLQLASLPQPQNPGPAESSIAASFINFATQPQNAKIPNGGTATFTVVATGSGTVTYQWQKAAATSTNFADIAGATSATFTTGTLTVADAGTKYRVNVTVPGLTLASAVATVDVDVTPPTLISVSPLTPDIIVVKFSEGLQPLAATNSANFTVDGGVTVSGATLSASDTITVQTSPQTSGTVYKLTVTGVKDVVGNTIISTNMSFTGVSVVTGLTLQRYFDNITDTDPTHLLKDPRYPNSPASLTLEPLFEYPPNGGNEAGDNYDNELSGWFTPPTTGNYVFYLCSDDFSRLYLSTDDNPVNKKLIASETVWSNARQWQSSAGSSDLTAKRSDQFTGSQWPGGGTKLMLTAGQHYYIEALHHEGGGGDNVGVYLQLPGAPEPSDGDPAMDSKYISLYIGAGSFPAFSLVSALGSPDFTHATLTFSFQVNATAVTNLSNFSISGGLTVSAATITPDGKGIVLTTSTQTGGTTYTVTVKNVTDALGRALPANSTATFAGFVLGKGAVIQKYWNNIQGNTIANLTSDPRFPDSPSFTTLEPRFEYPPNGADEAGDNYGNQLTGFLIPPTTGDYIFFVCSDDPSELYLSTDDKPANKKLIAMETAWSNARQWTSSGGNSDLASKRSDQFPGTEWPTGNKITLTAGKMYYMEALHTEGGGGDNVGATWQKPGDTAVPADGSPAIDGSFFANFLPPASVTITQQPQSITVVQSTTATFTVGASSTSPLTYQWQKAPAGGTFADIAGATSASFTTGFVLLTDNQSRYHVIVTGVGTAVTSADAVLTVTPDTTPPTIASALRNFTNQNAVIVKFSEPVGVSANVAANYKINGTAATAAVLGSDSLTVVLTSSAALANGSTNTLTVSGVSDLAGNVIAANSQVKIGFQKGILFVGADPGPLTFPGDIAVNAHLLARGFDVQLTTGSAVPDDGSTANGKDLIVESSSLSSGTTVAAAGGSKFLNLPIPAIEWEASNQDDFDFQAANGTTTANQTQINIVDNSSPLAAGFPVGLLTVVTSPQTFSQGTPTGAHIVATLAADTTQDVFYYYEKGDKGFNGFVMPARRVFFWFQDNTAAAANDAGWKLFDATVDWALGVQATTGGQPKLSVSHSGNTITISWTNGGTLQSTTSLASPITWKTETTTSPFTTTAAGTAKFYRVSQ